MNYTNYVASIVTTVLLLTYSITNAQQCVTPPLGGDNCLSAPELSCNLDGYTGTTAGFSADSPPPGFCGIIENNQFLSFRADESPVILKITPSNCSDAKGIQASLYETTNCVAMTPVSTCGSLGFASTITVTASVVTIGTLYHLMIDGFEGDICEYSIDVVSGILSDIEAQAVDQKMCLGTEIQLNGNGSSTGTNVAYRWEASNGGQIVTGANTLTPTINQIGDYTLTVLDTITCCMDKTMITVTETAELPTIVLVADGVVNCTNAPIHLSAAGTDTGDFTYEWTTPNGNFLTATNTLDTQVDTHGTYDLTVVNTLTGCVATDNITVVLDTIRPDVMAVITDKITCTQPTVDLMAQSMTNGTTFEWTNANGFQSNIINPNVTQSGIYTLTATATNGCTQSIQAEVLEDITIPQVLATVTDTLTCAKTQLEITTTTTEMLAYNWSGPNNFSSNNNNPMVTDAGLYALEVTGTNGCTETLSVEVIADVTTPDISIAPASLLTCQQTAVVLNPISNTPNLNYQWSNATDFNNNTANPSVTETGLYSLVVTGQNACTNIETILVENDTIAPIAVAEPLQTLTCAITEVQLNANNSSQGTVFAYEWQDAAGQALTNQQIYDTNAVGTYTLSVLNEENGCTAETSVNVVENTTLPVVDAGENQSLSCQIGTLMVGNNSPSLPNLESNYTYEWTNSDNISIGNTISTAINTADTYQLVVTDTENGCSSSDAVIISEDLNSPNLETNTALPFTCERQEVQLLATASSISGNFEVLWQNENNQPIANQLATTVFNPGTYAVIITDTQNGCSTSNIVIVEEDIVAPSIQVETPTVITCANPMTMLDANGSSTGAMFEYTWQNMNAITISNELQTSVQMTGQYDLLVTNTENGCTATQAVQVTENIETPYADTGIQAVLTCDKTEVDLSIGASSQGDTFTYQWKNEEGDLLSETEVMTFQEVGDFQLIVTNIENGCTDEALVLIQEDIQKPIAEAGDSDELTCTETQITLDATNSVFTGNVAFRWENSVGNIVGTEEYATVSNPDTYRIFVKNNDNGCEDMDQVEILENKTAPPAEVPLPNILTCLHTEEILLANSSLHTETFNYQWSDATGNTLSNDQFLEVQTAGDYHLVVTDAENGCTQERAMTVEEDRLFPTADAGEADLLTCVKTLVELDATNSSTGTQFEYAWTNSQGILVSNAAVFETENSDTYTLAVTDTTNDCVTEDVVVVDQNIENPQAIITSDETVLTCATTAITLNGNESNGTAPLNFQWLENETVLSNVSSITASETGVYSLFVTNAENGCTHTQSLELSQNIKQPEVIVATPDVITCTLETIKLLANPVEIGNYEFHWKTTNGEIVTGSNTASPTVQSSGTYELVTTDIDNACFSSLDIEVKDDLIEPTVQAVATAELDCVTESVYLSGAGTSIGNYFTYEWTGEAILAGINSLEPEVAQAGLYTLTVINQVNGCANEETVLVEENKARPTAALVEVNDPLCFGQNNGNIFVDGIIGGTAPYLYAFDNQGFSPQNGLFNLEEGTHQLSIQDAIGCEWDTIVRLDAPILVAVDLGEDIVLSLGETATLEAFTSGDIQDIEWTASNNTENSASNFLEIAPLETSTYEILVMDENGCLDTDEIVVRVQKDRNVFIPNAFSPNADGINDLFQVFSDSSVENIKQLNVFDRWGEQIFNQKDIDPADTRHGWNGEYRSQKMRPGVYVYFVEIEFIDGKVEIYKGDVTLIN